MDDDQRDHASAKDEESYQEMESTERAVISEYMVFNEEMEIEDNTQCQTQIFRDNGGEIFATAPAAQAEEQHPRTPRTVNCSLYDPEVENLRQCSLVAPVDVTESLFLLEKVLASSRSLPQSGDEDAASFLHRKQNFILENIDLILNDHSVPVGSKQGNGSLFASTMTLLDLSDTKVTKVMDASSGRCLYLFESSFTRPPQSQNKLAAKNDASHYVCLLPGSSEGLLPNGQESGCDVHEQNGYYCSCRSFFDRNKASNDWNERRREPSSQNRDGLNASSPRFPINLCKHLLALLLLPHLEAPYQTVLRVSSSEFSQYILQRIFPASGP